MSYQVLARKWRPHNFQQVVGQQHVLTALVNALDQDRLHHAYLLSGTRGVGKTTIARILAKSLNCEQGITSKPCGECSTCVEIDQGSYVDLLEIDAASRTKVEDTRELLDNVQYKPARGRFKVYLIDEVHMLSKHSFNALLKTLEEPPEYVKFLLATTDPQKLPITILSRCLQFHLKSLTGEQISKQLVHVLSQEHCQYELSALNAIAKAADGSMRDALSLTDQALSHGAGEIRHQAVLDMLGTLDHNHIIQLLQLLVAGDANACMNKIAEVSLLGPDYDQLHVELASLLHRIAMGQILPSSIVDTEQAEAITALCQQMLPEDVQLYYQISLTGRKELPLAPDPRSALEMTVLRLLAFRPQGKIQQPVAALTTSADVLNEAASEQQIPPQVDLAQPVSTPITQTEVKPLAPPAVIASEDMQQLNAEQNDIMQAAQDMGYAPIQVTENEAPVHVTSESTAMPAPVLSQEQEQSQTSISAPAESSVDQVRKTRNFLRSRLGTSAKKPIAAKSEKASSSQYVPPKKVVSEIPQQAQTDNVSISQQEQPSSQQEQSPWQAGGTQPQSRLNTGVAAPANSGYNPTFGHAEQMQQAAPSMHEQNMPTSDDLPPLEAYQDSSQSSAPQRRSSELNPPRQTDRFSHVNVDINELSPAFQPQQAQNKAEIQPVDNKLRDESDTWCRYINQMDLGGRVRQMALHSTLDEQAGLITLTMNPDQRYFANEKSKQQLKDALMQVVGNEIELQINFGEDSEKQTPAQIEEKIYQQRLATATQNIYADKNVLFFINRLGAELDDSSILPL